MFFLLKVRELVLDPRLSIGLPILFYVWFNVIYSILSFPLGAVSDKIGRVPVLISGYSIFGLVCLGFVWSRSLVSLILLFGLSSPLSTERLWGDCPLFFYSFSLSSIIIQVQVKYKGKMTKNKLGEEDSSVYMPLCVFLLGAGV